MELYEYVGSSRKAGESFELLYTVKNSRGEQTTYSWTEFHTEPPLGQKFCLVKYTGKFLPVIPTKDPTGAKMIPVSR